MGKDKSTKGHCGECCWFIGEDTYGNGMCAKMLPYGMCSSPFNDEPCKCEDECHEDHFVSREEMRHHLAVLMLYQRWRRSDQPTGFYKMPDPKEVGKAIDFCINYIKTFMEL